MNSELLSNVQLINKDERNNNCNSTKQKFEQGTVNIKTHNKIFINFYFTITKLDVLETPRIDQFKHENNPFASSFKDEVLKVNLVK